MEPDEKVKIWAAGFFDGEGSIFIRKHKIAGRAYYVLGCALGNTSKDAIDILRSVWAGDIYKIHEPGKQVGSGMTRRRWYQVEWRSDTAYRVLLDLSPYLIVKRAQFVLAKEFMEKTRELRSLRTSGGRWGRQTGIERRYTEEVYKRMHELNRGIEGDNRNIVIDLPKLL